MTPAELEKYVRKLSRLKWPGSIGGSETIAGTMIDHVSRDKVNETTRLIEITVERQIDKVREDINKLVAAQREESLTAFTVECWMIMSGDPTPNQRQLAKSSRVRLVSLAEFEDQLFPKNEYSHLRSRYPFGSVGDPLGELSDSEITRIETPIAIYGSKQDITPSQLLSRLFSGETVILLGDFWAGKSLLTRSLYQKAEAFHEKNRDHPFPVAVNLRDHWGQRTADELFLRHLQRVGSSSGLDFYRAWQEGLVLLMLDGFDEVAPQPWTRDRTSLHQLRRQAVAAIRDVVERRPAGVGLLISGRSQYFQSHEELCDAISLSQSGVTIVELRELTPSEASAFLPSLSRTDELGKWIPRRPLFLS